FPLARELAPYNACSRSAANRIRNFSGTFNEKSCGGIEGAVLKRHDRHWPARHRQRGPQFAQLVGMQTQYGFPPDPKILKRAASLSVVPAEREARRAGTQYSAASG